MSTKRKIVSNSAVLESKKYKLDVLKPDIINFISVPPLETMAIVKIATSLFNQTIIRDKIRQLLKECDPNDPEFNKRSWNDGFYYIKNAVQNNLFQLMLPDVLKNKVSRVIGPIALQIKKSLLKDLNDIDYFDSICWTNEGTIDKMKTLKQLIKENNGQHTQSIFTLSCKCCLEESINDSWAKLPRNFKVIIRDKMYNEYDCHLIAYWIHALNNDLDELLIKIKCDFYNIYNCSDSIYKNMVNLSIFIGNDLALRYFWEKLTDTEISSNLKHWINDAATKWKGDNYVYLDVNGYGNMLFYLISKVSNREVQKEILTNNQKVVLNSLFVNWPWQRHLLPTIQVIWECIDFKFYAKVLNKISKYLMYHNTIQYIADNIVEEILNGLCCDSPVNLKKQMIQSLMKVSPKNVIFSNLMEAGNIRTIKAFLEYANVEEQKHITLSFVENYDFHLIIEANKIDLFENVFLSKLSVSDVNRIKEKIFSENGERVCRNLIICNNDLIMLEKFLNWACNKDQIDTFKKKKIDKEEIVFRILYWKGNYELVEKFLDWCFDSKEQILQFKKEVLAYMPRIVKLGEEDWHKFELFLDWCFDSEEEIDFFRSYLLESDEFLTFICASIADTEDCKFEFVDRLLSWCCNSKEELEKFKAFFVLSPRFIGMLQRFVDNDVMYHCGWSNWELIKKSMKCFSPLKEDTKIKLKMKISSSIGFEDYQHSFINNSVYVGMLDLFFLLDDDTYNLSEKRINYDYDSDVYGSYDNFRSDDTEDNNLNNSYYFNISLLVLSEILNKLEKD